MKAGFRDLIAKALHYETKQKLRCPFLSLVFLVVGVSGLLMFFHLLDGYTEVVHELFGLFFVICAIFHIILKRKALKIHFKKAVFAPAMLGMITISAMLIAWESMYPAVNIQLMDRIIRAPVADAFKALGINKLPEIYERMGYHRRRP